jgi:hypothetical protein
LEVDRKLKALARYLQPFFLESPPDLAARGLERIKEGLRIVRRFRRIAGAEIGEMAAVPHRQPRGVPRPALAEKSDAAKRMILANNVYGKHGGLVRAGLGGRACCSHLLAGGDNAVQGFNGHVMGGMGAVSGAIAAAAAALAR